MALSSNPAYHTPPVVKNLMIFNTLVFLAQTLLPIKDEITTRFALYFWESDFFQPYQYITYMFLHGDFSHLFFNMFALWMFGRTLEYDLGSKRFLTFYLVTGIGAGLLYSLANLAEINYYQGHVEPYSLQNIINVPTLGASGAIYGVLLGFGMMRPNAVIMLLIPPIPMKAKYFVIIFMIIELVSEFTISDNVAHLAHVGGMIWAFILIKYWRMRGVLRR